MFDMFQISKFLDVSRLLLRSVVVWGAVTDRIGSLCTQLCLTMLGCSSAAADLAQTRNRCCQQEVRESLRRDYSRVLRLQLPPVGCAALPRHDAERLLSSSSLYLVFFSSHCFRAPAVRAIANLPQRGRSWSANVGEVLVIVLDVALVGCHLVVLHRTVLWDVV